MAAKVAPDRLRVSQMRLWAMAVLTAVMVWSALASLPNTSTRGGPGGGMVTQASALVAVLAVFGLRSIPVRRVVRAMALLTGIMLARFGQLSATEGLSGSWKVLAWVASVGVALVLAPSSRSVVVDVDTHEEPAMTTVPGGGSGGDPDGRSDGRSDGRGRRRGAAVQIETANRGRIPTTIALAAVSLLLGFALLIGPRVSTWFPTGSSAGDLVDRSGDRSDNVLAARESLDMTSRPRLSDKVVMTVRSPIVSFWRAEVFDTWDGSTWTRSYGRSGNMLTGGRATPSPDDLAAFDGAESIQEFNLQVGFATVLPAAPSPVTIDSSVEVAQRTDGTLVSPYRPVGRGTRYTVTSRQMPLQPQRLRETARAADAAAEDPVAALVIDQYARPPVVTPRVAELATRVTADATTDFDRILALERWMGDNTTYSLDAPLSPRGVDVVDHFLFDSKEGWCEQIASSLVVMARAVGIPARLATGYAPGEWDSAGGRFVVRERDAHAWAEVWFPDNGWVPFDPTAAVPLAGTDEAAAGATARDWREVLGAVLLVVGLVSVAWSPVVAIVQRVFASLRRRRASRRDAGARWEVRAERRLEHIGEKVGRPRGASQTVTSYAATVAAVVDDDRLTDVGVALDRVAYGSPTPDTGDGAAGIPREQVESILESVADTLD